MFYDITRRREGAKTLYTQCHRVRHSIAKRWKNMSTTPCCIFSVADRLQDEISREEISHWAIASASVQCYRVHELMVLCSELDDLGLLSFLCSLPPFECPSQRQLQVWGMPFWWFPLCCSSLDSLLKCYFPWCSALPHAYRIVSQGISSEITVFIVFLFHNLIKFFSFFRRRQIAVFPLSVIYKSLTELAVVLIVLLKQRENTLIKYSNGTSRADT